MMVIKLSLQVDFFVLRPKIETKRYNVVHVFIVVAVLPCCGCPSVLVFCFLWVSFWVLKKVHLKNDLVTYLLLLSMLCVCFAYDFKSKLTGLI